MHNGIFKQRNILDKISTKLDFQTTLASRTEVSSQKMAKQQLGFCSSTFGNEMPFIQFFMMLWFYDDHIVMNCQQGECFEQACSETAFSPIS